jgi:hypothetical protein
VEFLEPLLAALRPVVTAEAIKVLDEIAARAASGAEEDIRQAERDLLAWITRHRDCGHGGDLTGITERLDRIETTLKEIKMSQSDIDSATSAIQAEVADLGTQDAAILAAQQAFAAEIAGLQGAGADTSGLVAATAALLQAQGANDSTVAALTAASEPAPASPPADGGDGSVPAGQ